VRTKDGDAVYYTVGATTPVSVRAKIAPFLRDHELALYDETSPPPAEPPGSNLASQLRELAALRDDGVLSEEEFARQKAKLLGE